MFFAQVRENDDWKFQALADVDAHDANSLLGLADDRRPCHVFLFLQVFEEAQETVEPLAKKAAELRGALMELHQVGDALLAVD
jgi:hypothetical protein